MVTADEMGVPDGAAEVVGDPNDGVVARAFRIVNVFEPGERSLSLAEIARRTGLPKSTVHRLIGQLLDWRVLERQGERLRLGIKLFEWGSAVPQQRTVRDAALPYMEDLYEATHETVHLGLLDGHEVVYVNKICGHRPTRVPTAIGLRMPVYCTGLGKAILAFSPDDFVDEVVSNGLMPRTPYTIVSLKSLRQDLERARHDGVAYDREESVLGVSCVAAPVLNPDGYAIGAISVTGPSSRAAPERYMAAVKVASLSLSRELRGRA